MKIDFFWNVSVNKTVYVISGRSELFWYGVSIGNFGIGLLVKRLTPLAPDACPVCHLRGAPKGVEGCGNSSCPSRAGKA